MKATLLDLFHRHVGMAFHRQLQFADCLESQSNDGSWRQTISTAELTLGGSLRYVAPYLGSYAEGNHSWLWAWNNPQFTLPESGHDLAGRVRILAMLTGSQAFASAGLLDADELFGEIVSEHTAHAMGAIICGLLKYDAYYTLPFAGGCGVVVFHEPALRTPDPHPLITLCSQFSQLISALPVPDHKAAFVGYSTDLGLTLEHSGSTVHGSLAGEGSVVAEFDNLNRLMELKSTLNPRP